MDLPSSHKEADASLAETGAGDTAVCFDPLVLKRLKLKADCILLPLLTFGYLLE